MKKETKKEYIIYNNKFQNVINQIPTDSIIVSDPPYNIGYKYHTYQDNLEQKTYLQMLTTLITKFPTVIILYHEILHELTAYNGIIPTKIMEWIYNGNLSRQHRAIAYYGIKPDLEKVRQPYKNTNEKKIQKLDLKRGAKSYDWWNIPQVKGNSKEKRIHPCPTPLKLMNNIIKVLPPEKTICDPFMGGGTTGVACLKNNRHFIGIELDTLYYEDAKKRLEETNKQRRLI